MRGSCSRRSAGGDTSSCSVRSPQPWACLASSSRFMCSQNRKTVHLAPSSRTSVSGSRATFRTSFARHHSRLFGSSLPRCGQRCQKRPSTNAATRGRVKAMSIRRRRVLGTTGHLCSRETLLRTADDGAVAPVACHDASGRSGAPGRTRLPGLDSKRQAARSLPSSSHPRSWKVAESRKSSSMTSAIRWTTGTDTEFPIWR